MTRSFLVDRVFTRVTGRHGRGLQEKAGRRLLMAVAHELAAGRPVVVERGGLVRQARHREH